jgi:hypothetical protein
MRKQVPTGGSACSFPNCWHLTACKPLGTTEHTHSCSVIAGALADGHCFHACATAALGAGAIRWEWPCRLSLQDAGGIGLPDLLVACC